MTIAEMAPYILRLTDTLTGFEAPIYLTPTRYQEYSEILSKSKTASKALQLTETANAFFSIEETLRTYIPLKEREEFYYALKNGFFYQGVPSYGLYYILKIYNLYKSPNLIFKCLPERVFNVLCADNYLSKGIRWADVICNACEAEFKPLSDTCVRVVYSNYTELYIRETDMVALVPNSIATRLSDDDIRAITVFDGALTIGGKYLTELVEKLPVTPTYDLRCLDAL